MKHSEDGSLGVRPPRVLKNTERVGFSDLLVDPGGVVRRALLFMDDGDATLYSLSLRRKAWNESKPESDHRLSSALA